MATKVFISFDYDNDLNLKNFLVGQAKNDDSPFEIEDWSVKTESAGWVADARSRISRSDQVAVICGKNMTTAVGVNTEIELARELDKPYFLLAGYSDGGNVKPTTALSSDKLYKWTWENLKSLIAGSR
jgi:hypothetical protein